MAENEILNRAFEKGILKKTHVILLKYLVQKLDVFCGTLYSDLSLQEWDLVTALFELSNAQIIKISENINSKELANNGTNEILKTSQDFRIKLQDNWFSLIDEKINKNQQINIAYIDVLRACLHTACNTHVLNYIYINNNNINNINNNNDLKEKENLIKEKEKIATNKNDKIKCLDNQEQFELEEQSCADLRDEIPSREEAEKYINDYMAEYCLTELDFKKNYRDLAYKYLSEPNAEKRKNYRTRMGWRKDLEHILQWKNIGPSAKFIRSRKEELEKKEKTTKEFKKPTINEIKTVMERYVNSKLEKDRENFGYLESIDLNYASEYFYNYYESVDWRVNGKLLSKWWFTAHRALVSWENLRNTKSKLFKANYDAQITTNGFNAFHGQGWDLDKENRIAWKQGKRGNTEQYYYEALVTETKGRTDFEQYAKEELIDLENEFYPFSVNYRRYKEELQRHLNFDPNWDERTATTTSYWPSEEEKQLAIPTNDMDFLPLGE